MIELVDARVLGDGRREFQFAAPVHDGGPAAYTCDSERGGSPVADALLAVDGVLEVSLDRDVVTVVKQPDASWDVLDERVQYALASGVEQLSDDDEHGLANQPLDDDAMFDLVSDLFRREINPAVARHGGKVELIDVQNATVVLRMQGGCQGCGMASVTLKQGIEGSLRRMVPGFAGIQDVTDHAAGTDPYFSAQKQ